MNQQNTQTYLEKRLFEIGIAREAPENHIKLKKFNSETFLFADEMIDNPIFSEDANGNIDILIYRLNRETIHYDHPNAKPDRPDVNNNRYQTYKIKRLREPKTAKDGSLLKYLMPKGQSTYPFFPPGLVEKFEKGKEIENLIITEGQLKAFKAALHGFDCIGLSGVHNAKDRRTNELFVDIQAIIKQCKVKNIIILFDGDCRALSSKAFSENNEIDLYKRPNSFFTAAQNLHQLLKDLANEQKANIYFAHIKSDEIPQNPKGLDDLLIAFKGSETAILNDFKKINGGIYFHKILITDNLNRLLRYFHIDSADSFHEFYAEQIKGREYLYNGTKYKWNEQKEELEIIIPAAAKYYMRVATDYYKKVKIPNKFGTIFTELKRWDKTTISEDHGKNFVKHVPKYESFCTVPQHMNFQQVIHNCYNKYFPFEHEPETGDCSLTLKFLEHIFAEQFEIGLDYIQLLYQKPIQILPILCLVSRERHTGKTTFLNWLARVFRNNTLFVGNEDLSNAFNSPFQGRLLVFVEETLIEKQATLERIKNLSTAHETLMNAKGKDQAKMDVFMKFIFCSNNEDSFIYVNQEEIRFWVRKIGVPDFYNTNLLDELTEEIPYFLHFLNKRKLHTKEQTRMHFAADDLMTDALRKIMKNSRPTIEKIIRSKLKEMFIDFREDKILLTCNVISKQFFNNRYDVDYISRILRNNLNVDQYRNETGKIVVKKFSYPVWSNTISEPEKIYLKDSGRPYVFHREQFVTEKEWNEIEYEAESMPF